MDQWRYSAARARRRHRFSQYHGHMVEWQARANDLLADDWVVYEGKARI